MAEQLLTLEETIRQAISQDTSNPSSTEQQMNYVIAPNPIVYNQLLSCYASNEEDLNELATLLLDWNLSELYSFFVGKYFISVFS